MNRYSLRICSALLWLLLLASAPAESVKIGQPLVPADALGKASLSGPLKAKSSLELVPANHPDFTQAWRVSTSTRSAVDRDLQLGIPISGKIKRNDVLFIEFWVRLIHTLDETGDARGTISMEQERAVLNNKTLIKAYPWFAGKEWKRICMPVISSRDLESQGSLLVRLGIAVQTVEIGGLNIRGCGPDFDLSKLPPPTFANATYAGREANAPWRKAAADRIEKYRKADLTIEVQTADGKPVPNAVVEINQTRNAFRFSSAIAAQSLLTPEKSVPGSDRYREIIPQLFNEVTMESDLKWPNWESNRERTLGALDWARQRNLPVRGHVLMWPSWWRTPADLPSLAKDPAALRKRILDHVTDILTATGDRVEDWDVINEPQTHNDVIKALGDGILVECFQEAKKLHPNGHLFLNEALNFSSKDKLPKFEQQALDLRKRGAPIDGLGFQAHYGWELTPPDEIYAVLEKFAAHGFILQVTEFDMDITDQSLQADYLRDFFTVVFSHPAVDTIQMWGFWESRHWRPTAALWNKDWTPRPAGQAYLDLMKEWSTHTTMNTDESGRAKVRGFLGDYSVTVKASGKNVAATTALVKNGTTLKVTLP